ncbi:MAG: hypothetical protein A2117_01540 [Candidatus Wildermuthbacteria bacterium GWA2_46_15]|uniref:SHSP domain-containing protein n=1 Tax=Candidatus Wildermuthbacteria bacterium GWA2_46_15 TaxID=1802443 RepID=A0A1G2QPK6_9BACT|nr:MAG: hypothetical protein A2117_01540 [Candidatus Wildermuthbacteria bacterium GWA2_46_15]
MASFFEKLIGSQDQVFDSGAQTRGDHPVKEKKPVSQKPARKVIKPILKVSQPEEDPEEKEPEHQFKTEKKVEIEPEEEEETEEMPTKIEKNTVEKTERKKPAPQEDSSKTEGQLSIDVYQTDGEVVIDSTIGGVKPENLEVTIENGMVQIRGNREKIETVEKDDYLIQECHWGSFSRQFVLPSEVDASRAEATLKDGILTIRIPRIQKEKVTKLMIR